MCFPVCQMIAVEIRVMREEMEQDFDGKLGLIDDKVGNKGHRANTVLV